MSNCSFVFLSSLSNTQRRLVATSTSFTPLDSHCSTDESKLCSSSLCTMNVFSWYGLNTLTEGHAHSASTDPDTSTLDSWGTGSEISRGRGSKPLISAGSPSPSWMMLSSLISGSSCLPCRFCKMERQHVYRASYKRKFLVARVTNPIHIKR